MDRVYGRLFGWLACFCWFVLFLEWLAGARKRLAACYLCLRFPFLDVPFICIYAYIISCAVWRLVRLVNVVRSIILTSACDMRSACVWCRVYGSFVFVADVVGLRML
ncbi:hypothetical protein B0T20DRAFT_424342 [Sordaria brevicollis]|uniref:Uncharacterized protein n=1 Tax=Sordaria brevicollis TaxID=83679 RepID=A0AAE0U5R9_SORBR|nr:hypothetical protein B0T20DRAFT_424342 [Sordaria brevicollis]